MIKLEKGAEPAVLVANSAAWTRTLTDKLARGEKPTEAERRRYNHPAIKSALLAETFGKCAYCESKLLHISYGDIEHVVPKSSRPELTFSWQNLTVACDICNTKKGHNAGDIVDPYISDPESAFTFYGPLVFAKFGHDAAKRTEIILELNRAPLVEKRKERLMQLRAELEAVTAIQNHETRKIALEAAIAHAMSAENEYAAISRVGCRALAQTMPGRNGT